MESQTDISYYLKQKCEFIEQHLEILFQNKAPLHQELYQAARYSILGSGKRLRPILALATAEMLGCIPRKAIIPACTLEMIHTYSLIHDDLPCMDNDDFRRGKPSLHKAFSEGLAVLTGDFLLTYAFESLAEAPYLTPQQKIELIKILSKKSGGEGMIAGQVLDLSSEGKEIDLTTLQTIHSNKTGAMITASIEFGAVIANASIEHLQLLKEFGEEIGLAFQIIDDILDITQSQQKHGRAVASDLTNAKSTYVSLLGMEPSKKLAEELLSTAQAKIDQLPYDTSLLNSLAKIIVTRNH